jgi:hypothetical protein
MHEVCYEENFWNPPEREGSGLAFPSDQVIRAGARNPIIMLNGVLKRA